MWKGIEIHSTTYITNIYIHNNSIVSKAEKGLYLATSSDSKAWIDIRDSYFNDNFKAIELVSRNMAGRAVWIRGTTIQITPSYPLSIYDRQVYLGNFPFFGISNINFKNTKDVLALKAGGLYSYNGYVTINSGNQEGFEKGLEGIGFGIPSQMSVKSFNSIKSANHISVNSRRGNKFRNLIILQGDRNNLSGTENNFGLKLVNCQSNSVRDNTFTNSRTIGGFRSGFIIDRVGSEKQVIGINNSFTSYDLGASSLIQNSKVEFLCNTHSQNGRDFSWSSINRDQGTLFSPAGNLFSVATPLANNVNILSQSNVTYFHGIGTGEFPASVNPLVTRTQVEVSGCSYTFFTPSNDIALLDNDYNDLIDQITELSNSSNSSDPGVQDQIHTLELQLQQVFNQAFSIITSPIEGQINNSLLIEWLERVNTFESYAQIAFIYLMAREYTAANSSLAFLSTNFSLTNDQQAEVNAMTWLFNFITPIFQSGRWEGDFTTAEVLTLQNFALNNLTNTGLMANNILEFFYNIQNNGGQLKKKSDDVSYMSNSSFVDENEKEFIIFPNPTNGNIHINFNNKELSSIYRAEIRDVNGILKSNIQFQEVETKMDVSLLPKGVYFITLFKNDEIVRMQKIVRI